MLMNHKLPTNYKIVWKPIENSSQELAVDTRCNETLLCGTRGGGKTETQLAAFAKYVGVGYGRFWRGIIFDKEYKNLEDIIIKSHRMFGNLPNCKYNIKDSKWTWSTGEELLFRRIRLDEDYWNYHGHEYPFIGWNELTKYNTSYLYDTMMSCNRSGFNPAEYPKVDSSGNSYCLPELPLMVFSTTNPYGAGHQWVKQRFIDVAPYGEVVVNKSKVFNPRTQQTETVSRTQIAIFSSYRENKYLSKEYIAGLESQPNPNMRKAWLTGSWDIVSGGMFGDNWDRDVHVIPRFAIPKGWYIDRTFDWGSTHPFSVGWWAVANGEEVNIINNDGSVRKFCPPKGSLIQFFEYYGSERLGTNIGTKLGASDIAKRIVQLEHALLRTGWIKSEVSAGAADNQIWSEINSDTPSIAGIMEGNGVRWKRSIKSAGSRVNGVQLFNYMLKNTLDKSEQPHIYFMSNCAASIGTIPVLQVDEKNPDDVDTSAEDHAWDMTRYRILDGYVLENNVLELKF